MKTLFCKNGLLVLFFGGLLNCNASPQEELLNLSRIDLLPKFNSDTKIRQISSYDTTGGNDDGFSGKYSYLRKGNGNLVIAELKGPGVIQRIWTPTPTQDTIQFFFDNETEPRIDLKFIDLFSGSHYPFSRPVVGNEVGGYYCYIPIPYQKSCKIVFKGELMQFIQIQYSEASEKKQITSFPRVYSEKEKLALAAAVKAWSSYGKEVIDLAPSLKESVKNQTATVLLKPGETTGIFEQNSGGRIVGIELIPQADLNMDFKDLILSALWDDEPVAAINCPLSDFFGYAFGRPSMQSMIAGVKDRVHYCFFPMPYDKKASLKLTYLKTSGNASREIPCKVTIYYNDSSRKENEGKFYASWKREINPGINKPYTILEKKGRGNYVGTLLQAQGLNPGMTIFFEGDDICYIDGEMRLHGTGSEDSFNGGWYALPDRWDQAFSLPVHGALAYSIPLAHTGGYRFYISDKLSFENNFNLEIEHGPENNLIPVDYTSVAFYYCDTPPAKNDLPLLALLSAIKPPSTMEYWIELLPVKAISYGATLMKWYQIDSRNKNNYDVLRLEAAKNGYVKYELEVPADGEYKLYLSYFIGPDCSSFTVSQRQIPVSQTIKASAGEYNLVEKEYIGNLNIKEGTNTLTIKLEDNPSGAAKGSFFLHRIFLEKI